MGWMRHPRTTAESRANEGAEVAEFVRSARNYANLPNAWDDFCRVWQRCWKRQRRGRKSWDR